MTNSTRTPFEVEVERSRRVIRGDGAHLLPPGGAPPPTFLSVAGGTLRAMGQVMCRDESASGRELASVVLETPSDRISARELVRLRVREEVARHNAAPTTRFRGLVHPPDASAAPDGCWLMGAPRRVDWELQAEAAVRAFERNGFVLIVGDHQVEHLDEVLDLTTAHEVAFVKLVPLVGG